MRGQEPEKALKALYAYTDCSVSVNVNMMVICENRPVQMTVTEVLNRNTEKLLEYLKRELELELATLHERFYEKTRSYFYSTQDNTRLENVYEERYE
jgi:topoisomerase-4 subunit A